MSSFDLLFGSLPRDVKLRVVSMVGRDARLALGIRPGKLGVPQLPKRANLEHVWEVDCFSPQFRMKCREFVDIRPVADRLIRLSYILGPYGENTQGRVFRTSSGRLQNGVIWWPEVHVLDEGSNCWELEQMDE